MKDVSTPILCTPLLYHPLIPTCQGYITLKNGVIRPALTVPDTHNLRNNIRAQLLDSLIEKEMGYSPFSRVL